MHATHSDRASTVAVTGPVQGGDPLGGIAVQPAEDHDAREVGLVAVVEDEVVAGA